MSTSPIGSSTGFAIQQLVSMRAQFDDLQRQLSTGLKSSNYAGLGLDRGVTVSLNAQLSAVKGYNSTIDNVTTRINLMSNSLDRMSDLGDTVRKAMVPSTASGSTTATSAQQTAQSSLDELLSLLNGQAGDRYMFSGRATDTPAVDTMDHILNGNGAQAGLKQIISERLQADLGANGLGRLTLSQPTATSVALTEDNAPPFGLKLASVTSNLTNGTVTGPTGSPASLSVSLAGNPNAGDTISLSFNLPDGTSQSLTLTATTSTPPGANQFTIGSTAAATATNLQAALNTGIGKLAATSLTAASAVVASNSFFDADANNPPQRVSGSPLTATSLTAGSSANTVIWYTGEAGTDSARATSTARIDQSMVVGYGARANEDGIRNLVQNVATLAAVTVSSSNPNGVDLSAALNQRLTANMNTTPGVESLTDIQTQIAGAQVALKSAQSRHNQTNATLSDFLQQIQGVSNEEVGTQLLALQTRMQASMATTSMLFQTTFVNYVK